MGALPSVPQTDPELGRAAPRTDIPADRGISADVALHAQRIADSRRRLDERVSMEQVATGTVAQFSAYMNAIRLQVQRTTSHVATNLDRLGLDSAVKGMTAELDRVVADLTEGMEQSEATVPQAAGDAAAQDTGWVTKLMQMARATILDDAELALQAQANTPSSWTLSLLRG
jgi:hypothetical protein